MLSSGDLQAMFFVDLAALVLAELILMAFAELCQKERE